MENQSRFWQSASLTLARRINIGWWLERWTGWLMATTLAGSVAVLLVRWHWPDQLRWVWFAIASLLVVGGVIAWIAGRRRFESPDAARVRLEDALGLKTRLSAAAAGVGQWPAPVTGKITWPVRWRWQRPLVVFLFTAAMFLLATLVPISSAGAAKKHVIEKPTAVMDVEKWVQELRREESANEKSLEDVEKKIADLLQRPSENWYEHGSLEAAGNLKEQTASELRELAENLADAERAASAMQAMGDTMPQAVKDSLSKGLQEAAQGLTAGGMKPNEQLLQQLQQMQPSELGKLTKEQMKQLAEQLAKNSEALKKSLAQCPNFDPSGIPGMGEGDGGGNGQGKKPGNGKKGEGPGNGGIDRGRGDAELTLSDDETNLDTKKTETIKSQLDINRVAPGDTLTVTDGKHEVDKNAYQGPRQAGGINGTGDGGTAVWQDSLMPSERATLKKYFK